MSGSLDQVFLFDPPGNELLKTKRVANISDKLIIVTSAWGETLFTTVSTVNSGGTLQLPCSQSRMSHCINNIQLQLPFIKIHQKINSIVHLHAVFMLSSLEDRNVQVFNNELVRERTTLTLKNQTGYTINIQSLEARKRKLEYIRID